MEPTEEMEPEKFAGGDTEIVAHAKHLIATEKGEIIDVDDSEDEDGKSDLCGVWWPDSSFCDADVRSLRLHVRSLVTQRTCMSYVVSVATLGEWR